MAANTVESTVKVNITADAGDMQSKLKDFEKIYDNIKNKLEKGIDFNGNIDKQLDYVTKSMQNLISISKEVGDKVGSGINVDTYLKIGNDILSLNDKFNKFKDDINATHNEIDNFSNQLAALSRVSENIDKSTNTTTKDIEYLASAFKVVEENLNNIKDVLPTNTFNNFNKQISELKSQLSDKDKFDTLATNKDYQKIYDNMIAQGGVLKSLKENSSMSVDTDAVARENEERQKNIDIVLEQCEALGKLKEQEDATIQSAIESGDLIPVNLKDLESVDLGKLDNLFTENDFGDNEINKTTDSLDKLTDAAKQANDITSENSNTNKEASDSQSKFAENSDLVKKALKEIVTTGHLSESTLEKLITTLGADSVAILALAAAVVVLKKVWNECSKAVDEFNDTALKFGEGAITGIADAFEGAVTGGVDLFIDAIGELIDVCEQAFDTLQEFSEYGIELEDTLFELSALIGSEATDNIISFTEALQDMYGVSSTELLSQSDSIAAAVASLGVYGDDLTTASESLISVSEDLSIFAGSYEKAASDLGNAISKGYIGRSSSLYKIFTKNELTEFKALNSELERYNYIMKNSTRLHQNYLKYLETDSGKVSLLNAQYSELTNNIGTIALKLYATVAPVLTNLLKLINTALSAFMSLFNIDTESFNLDSVSNDIADSLNNVGDAAEEATRQTASFDDVIQISDSSTDSLSGMDTSAVSSALDGILGMEDKARTEWDDLIDKIKEDIDNEDWGALGTDITDFFADKLESIDWNKINKNFEKAGKGIASFVNSVSANKRFWSDLGSTIGNSFNAINTGLYNFLKNFDGTSFGQAIGTMFKSMFDSIDTDLAGDTLYEALNSVTDIIQGWLDEGGLESAFTAITETLQRLFKDIADSGKAGDYAQTLYNFVKNIWESLYTSIVTLLNDDNVRSSFKSFVSTIFQNLAADSGDFADDIVNLVVSILSFIGETLINEENINNMITAISNFISGIADRKDDIVAALKPIVTALSNGLKGLMADGSISDAFNTLYDIFKESGVFDLIKEWMLFQMYIKINEILFSLKEKIETFKDVLVWVWDAIQKGQKSFIDNIGKWVIEVVNAFIKDATNNSNKIHTFFNNLGKSMASWISNFWPNIKSALASIWDSFKSWWNEHLANLSLDISVPDWIPGVGGKEWSIGIPKLATGGIATKSTIANIGEAGKEAILPLENNTGWMDTLATKIASKIQSPNTSGTGSVTIDMSKLTKAVYTRSELYDLGEVVAKSLNVYGYNVTLVK